jgi:hypothetical protein
MIGDCAASRPRFVIGTFLKAVSLGLDQAKRGETEEIDLERLSEDMKLLELEARSMKGIDKAITSSRSRH